MAKKTNGKRSSKTSEAPPRPKIRIPADQRALGRWGRKCLWTGSDYVAIPMGSGE
jgi:hypothetical protein